MDTDQSHFHHSLMQVMLFLDIKYWKHENVNDKSSKSQPIMNDFADFRSFQIDDLFNFTEV